MALNSLPVTLQVFGYITAEGGGSERGDGKSLPRFNSPGVDRGTRQPCNSSSSEDNRGCCSLFEGDGAIESLFRL